jgi:hypothetical protein
MHISDYTGRADKLKTWLFVAFAMVAFGKRTSLAWGVMVLVSSAALSITFFPHPRSYTVLDDSFDSSATTPVADPADTVDKILNQDEAADDWRRKAKTAGEFSDV